MVGVSGGGDSTALLHLLVRAFSGPSPQLAVAHLDHALRPGSRDDRDFVESLARRLALPFHAERADVAALARARRLGLEEAGRFARHVFLARVARQLGAAAVLLAHTMDDQAETLLLKLTRGAGTAGLAAMRPVQVLDGIPYRRPLLGLRRLALRRFLAAIGEPFRDDPTHADRRFARNRVRLDLLPALEVINPRAVEALSRTASILADDEDLLSRLAAESLPPSAASSLDSARLRSLPSALARRAVLRFLRAHTSSPDLGHEHIDAVLALARRARGPHSTDLPGRLRLVRSRNLIRVEPAPSPAPTARDARRRPLTRSLAP